MTSALPRPPLPEGWRWVRLGDVCTVVLGQSPPSSTYRNHPEGLPFFQGKKDFGTVSPIPQVWCVKPSKIAEAGDILVSVRAPVGPTNLATVRCCIGRGLAALRCGIDIDRDFLLHNIKLHELDLASLGSGSTFSAISGSQLRSYPIPLPSLAEQQRIVARLDEQMAAAERARRAADRMAEAARTLPNALLREIFPLRGENLPQRWRWVELGKVCRVVSGATPQTSIPSYWGGSITWITPKDLSMLTSSYIYSGQREITQSGYESCSTELVPAGSIVMSSRAPIGYLGIAARSLCVNQGCKCFVVNAAIDNLFLYFALRNYMSDIQALGAGTTFTEVSKSSLKRFLIPLPPLGEQQRIAALLNEQMADAERARREAEVQGQAMAAVSAALLRDAFTPAL